jgi:iron complex outermembrane receptor protein
VGIQLSELSKNYGIAGTDGNRIDLTNQVVRLAGEHREPFSNIDRVRWNLGYIHYRHAELESTGEVGTRFKNNNTEGRIELTHRDGLGAFGIQWQHANTSAVGEESLMTPTSQRQIGIFTVQEKAIATGRASFGMRYDWVGSDNQGSPDGVSRAETSRHFSLVNASAGWVQPLKSWVDWNANLSFSQRAPEIEALYAEGNHAAQQRYVIGNPNLKRERSINFDLGIKSPLAEHDKHEWKLNVFYRRFHDFIYGETVWDALAQQPVRSAEGLIEEQMRQQSATFKGIEASVQWQLPTKEWSVGAWGDIVSAKLADGSTPPRLAPARLALNARYQKGNWQAEVQGLHRFKPRHLAAYETDTEASTQLDAKLSYRYALNQNQPLNIWLEGTNLTNQLIRLHTSYLKDQAPLAGRGVHLGMELKF